MKQKGDTEFIKFNDSSKYNGNNNAPEFENLERLFFLFRSIEHADDENVNRGDFDNANELFFENRMTKTVTVSVANDSRNSMCKWSRMNVERTRRRKQIAIIKD